MKEWRICLKIIDFTTAHIEQAMRIAKENYERERGFVPALPTIENVPDLSPYAENGLGVAVFDGGNMLGFLCGLNPWDNAWEIPGLLNIFSPMGANGATGDNRAEVYAKMYQAAGAKWARTGAASHAVCLYAHDEEAQRQFFRYGFGMRTVDAIRAMYEIEAPPPDGYTFAEVKPEELSEVYPLDKLLDEYFIESPFFMSRTPNTEAEFLHNAMRSQPVDISSRENTPGDMDISTDSESLAGNRDGESFRSVLYFAARHNGKAVSFICAEPGGETFIQDTPGYLHCKGLYCLPEHRGKGIPKYLLSLLVKKLAEQGCTRLGVDFESINPPAYAFWTKHFQAYTYGVVRRIDEGAVSSKR
jgi:GNAT superfamily N-acetyltransferase